MRPSAFKLKTAIHSCILARMGCGHVASELLSGIFVLAAKYVEPLV